MCMDHPSPDQPSFLVRLMVFVFAVSEEVHERASDQEKIGQCREGAVANVVGIRRGAISGNMIVSAQAARSIG